MVSTYVYNDKLAIRQFSVRSRDVLMNAQCRHKWWSTLKSAVFSSSSYSSLPLLIWGWWGSGLWVGREGRYAVGPFWWKAVQGSSRSAVHLSSVSQSHYLCLQVTGGEAAPAGSRFLWWHWPIGNVSYFFEEDSCGSGPSSCCGISATPSFG